MNHLSICNIWVWIPTEDPAVFATAQQQVRVSLTPCYWQYTPETQYILNFWWTYTFSSHCYCLVIKKKNQHDGTPDIPMDDLSPYLNVAKCRCWFFSYPLILNLSASSPYTPLLTETILNSKLLWPCCVNNLSSTKQPPLGSACLKFKNNNNMELFMFWWNKAGWFL